MNDRWEVGAKGKGIGISSLAGWKRERERGKRKRRCQGMKTKESRRWKLSWSLCHSILLSRNWFWCCCDAHENARKKKSWIEKRKLCSFDVFRKKCSMNRTKDGEEKDGREVAGLTHCHHAMTCEGCWLPACLVYLHNQWIPLDFHFKFLDLKSFDLDVNVLQVAKKNWMKMDFLSCCRNFSCHFSFSLEHSRNDGDDHDVLMNGVIILEAWNERALPNVWGGDGERNLSSHQPTEHCHNCNLPQFRSFWLTANAPG